MPATTSVEIVEPCREEETSSLFEEAVKNKNHDTALKYAQFPNFFITRELIKICQEENWRDVLDMLYFANPNLQKFAEMKV
ncbi:MAG: hypothetical protein ChlgKO_07240 [Chlamydiales bacterium]